MTLLSASPLFENLGFWDICLRFLCAMAAGLIIGIEREYTHRPAGMRTHTLVALGSCAAMVVGQLLYAQYGGDSDPSRISAQVISGVGFLGAGVLIAGIAASGEHGGDHQQSKDHAQKSDRLVHDLVSPYKKFRG